MPTFFFMWLAMDVNYDYSSPIKVFENPIDAWKFAYMENKSRKLGKLLLDLIREGAAKHPEYDKFEVWSFIETLKRHRNFPYSYKNERVYIYEIERHYR